MQPVHSSVRVGSAALNCNEARIVEYLRGFAGVRLYDGEGPYFFAATADDWNAALPATDAVRSDAGRTRAMLAFFDRRNWT
jgi:hypothetical protein